MDKQFIQIQLSLFFQSDFIGAVEKVSLTIKEEFGEKVITQIIGLPGDAPSVIPRLMANSDLVNINLSKNRIDFFSKDRSFVENHFESVWNIINSLSLVVGRVGVVTTSFEEIATNELKELFNQSKIASLNPKEITIRFSEEVKIAEISANNSQMYVTGSAKDDQGVDKKGVVITRDINSLAGDLKKNIFTKETLNNFVSQAILLADETLV